MAGVQVTDGFDSYNGVGAVTATAATIQSRWALNSTIGLSLVLGLDGTAGTQAAQFVANAAGCSMSRQLVNPTRAVGSNAFRMKWTAFPNTTTLFTNFTLRSGATLQMGVRVNGDGTVSAFRLTTLGAGTLLGTSLITAPKVVLNTVHHFAIVWTLSTTVGAITVFLDGVAILTLTNVNNANGGVGSTADTFQFDQGGNSSSTFIVDDYYETDDAAFAGQAKVIPIRATADNTKVWTPNTGTTNFSRINENLVDGDTSYVQTSTVGDRDLYAQAGLAVAPASILGVQVSCWGEKTDVANRSIALSVRSGATDSDGPNFALVQSYGLRMDRFMALDPNTAAAWTNAALTALLFGPKVTV